MRCILLIHEKSSHKHENTTFSYTLHTFQDQYSENVYGKPRFFGFSRCPSLFMSVFPLISIR